MPGLVPVAEFIAWRVPKGITTVVEQEGQKPWSPGVATLIAKSLAKSNGGTTRCAQTVLAGSLDSARLLSTPQATEKKK